MGDLEGEGEDDSSSSQSGSGEGRGEDRCILSYRQLETSDSKDINYRQSLTKTNNPKLCTDSFARSNIHTSTSSILNSSPYIYLGDQWRSAQQTQNSNNITGIGGNPGNQTRQDESSTEISNDIYMENLIYLSVNYCTSNCEPG